MSTVSLLDTIEKIKEQAEQDGKELSEEDIFQKASDIMSKTQEYRFQDADLKEQFGLKEGTLDEQRKHDILINQGDSENKG
jgi:hypothetical protein